MPRLILPTTLVRASYLQGETETARKEGLPTTWLEEAADFAGRATRVPHGTVKSGTERTATVTDMWPMTWSPGALLHARGHLFEASIARILALPGGRSSRNARPPTNSWSLVGEVLVAYPNWMSLATDGTPELSTATA
jgi:hypothetical protein